MLGRFYPIIWLLHVADCWAATACKLYTLKWLYPCEQSTYSQLIPISVAQFWILHFFRKHQCNAQCHSEHQHEPLGHSYFYIEFERFVPFFGNLKKKETMEKKWANKLQWEICHWLLRIFVIHPRLAITLYWNQNFSSFNIFLWIIFWCFKTHKRVYTLRDLA